MEASPSSLLTSVTSQAPSSPSTLTGRRRFFSRSVDQLEASRSVLRENQAVWECGTDPIASTQREELAFPRLALPAPLQHTRTALPRGNSLTHTHTEGAFPGHQPDTLSSAPSSREERKRPLPGTAVGQPSSAQGRRSLPRAWPGGPLTSASC